MRSLAAEQESTSSALPALFAQIDENLSLIGNEDLDSLSPDELRERSQWLSTLTRTSQAISARYLAEVDRREKAAPTTDPDNTPCAWLCRSLHISDNAAYSLLRTA